MVALGLFVVAVVGITIFSILSWIIEIIEAMANRKIPILVGIISIAGIIMMIIYALIQIK